MKKYMLSALIVILFLAFMACDPGGANGEDQSNPNPKPVLNSISPTSVLSHTAAFTLTCSGSSYIQGAVIVFADKEMTANYVGSDELTCTINPDDTVIAGTRYLANPASDIVTVYVKNPPGYASQAASSLESEKLDFTIRTNHTFTDPKKLNLPAISHSCADIAINSEGNLFVVSSGNSGLYLIRSTDKGTHWSNRVKISNGGYHTSLLAFDSEDNINLLLNHGSRSLYFTRSIDSGDTWSDPIKIRESEDNDSIFGAYIAAGKKRNLVIVWFEGVSGDPGTEECYLSRSSDYGVTWKMTRKFLDSEDINICSDSEGNFNVVWMSSGTGMVDFIRSTDNGKGWTNRKSITSGHYPAIVSDSSGNINVLAGGGGLIFVRSTDNGKNWTETIRLPCSALTEYVTLSVDQIGNLNTVYSGYEEHFEPSEQDGIYYNRSVDNGATWTESLLLTSIPDRYHGIRSVCDKAGTIFVIWIEWKRATNEFTLYFTCSTD
ncbi:MAG: exo-alpha-sialidase [Candidatus Aminicenantes bacterium]|nr:exo-alpha-sialidase [Candidatus Aminicenantes bacterium]